MVRALLVLLVCAGVGSASWQTHQSVERERSEAERALQQVFLELPLAELEWLDVLRELESREGSLSPAESYLLRQLKAIAQTATAREGGATGSSRRPDKR